MDFSGTFQVYRLLKVLYNTLSHSSICSHIHTLVAETNKAPPAHQEQKHIHYALSYQKTL